MTKKDTTALRVDPSKEYKKRVKAAVKKLPRLYREIIYRHYPKYNTEEGRKLISNVVIGRSADIPLTGILEQIASKQLI